MRFLIEADSIILGANGKPILSSKTELLTYDELLTNEEKILFIKDYLNKLNSSNYLKFELSKILDVFIKAILKYGFNSKAVLYYTNLNNIVPTKILAKFIIDNLLNERDFDVNLSWLYNENLYNKWFTYKIKSLIFLSTLKARKYGNPTDDLKNRIVSSSNDGLVGAELTKWLNLNNQDIDTTNQDYESEFDLIRDLLLSNKLSRSDLNRFILQIKNKK